MKAVVRFVGQAAAAALLVTAVAFLGVGLEHSPLSRIVPALPSAKPGHFRVITNGHEGVIVNGHERAIITLPPGGARPLPRRGGGPGPPSDLSSWPTVGHVLWEIAAIALAVVALDVVRRLVRRKRRARRRVHRADGWILLLTAPKRPGATVCPIVEVAFTSSPLVLSPPNGPAR